MASRDYRAGMEPVLRPALAPDETLLAVSGLVKDPGTTDAGLVAEELKQLLDPAVHSGLGSASGKLIQQAAFGRALVGSPESMAGRLFSQVEAAGGPTIAVTATAVIIFDVGIRPRGDSLLQRWFGAVDHVAKLLYRVPRNNVIGARRVPLGMLRRGRIVMAFVDGSGCALVCAPPSLADPIATAIGVPNPGTLP